mmetsp:Transcript_11237/g.37208  ORF Transcript_11237/g.37208 Transcript_11237/m.37208 type:complete len:246 (+) Transcript_11237:332-1069(+)
MLPRLPCQNIVVRGGAFIVGERGICAPCACLPSAHRRHRCLAALVQALGRLDPHLGIVLLQQREQLLVRLNFSWGCQRASCAAAAHSLGRRVEMSGGSWLGYHRTVRLEPLLRAGDALLVDAGVVLLNHVESGGGRPASLAPKPLELSLGLAVATPSLQLLPARLGSRRTTGRVDIELHMRHRHLTGAGPRWWLARPAAPPDHQHVPSRARGGRGRRNRRLAIGRAILEDEHSLSPCVGLVQRQT